MGSTMQSGFNIMLFVVVSVVLSFMCFVVGIFSLRRDRKRRERTAATAENSAVGHNNNSGYPAPPWQGQASPPPTSLQSNSGANGPFVQNHNPYHIVTSSPGWNSTSSHITQTLPHHIISQPPRAAHPFHYPTTAPIAQRPHSVTQIPSHPGDRVETDDLLTFDAPEKEKLNPCPICLGPLQDEEVSTGQCLHLIHTSCLKGWLAKDVKSACPVCRVPYQDDMVNVRSGEANELPSTSELTGVATIY